MDIYNKVIKGVTYSGYVLASPLIFLFLPFFIVMYFFFKDEVKAVSILDTLAMAVAVALITMGWLLMLRDLLI